MNDDEFGCIVPGQLVVVEEMPTFPLYSDVSRATARLGNQDNTEISASSATDRPATLYSPNPFPDPLHVDI
jgi:hypothetical protein